MESLQSSNYGRKQNRLTLKRFDLSIHLITRVCGKLRDGVTVGLGGNMRTTASLMALFIFAIVISFQNCSMQLDSPSSTTSLSIDGDIELQSVPQDGIFYLTGPLAAEVVAVSHSNRTLLYQWFKDDVALSGQTSRTLLLSNLRNEDAGVYKIKVSNAVDQAEHTFQVAVVTSPVATITQQPVPISAAVGASFSLTVVAQSSDPAVPLVYQWYRAGTAINGATSATLTVATAALTDSGAYYVEAYPQTGVSTRVKSNSVSVGIFLEAVTAGCSTFTVPAGVASVRVVAVGGGGGGNNSVSTCAYNMLSGGGGAAVEAVIAVTPGAVIPYCVGAAGIGGSYLVGSGLCRGGVTAGGDSTFGTAIKAGGGAAGNSWHYKGEDGRGRPPSAGGVYTVTAEAQVIRAANGAAVTAFGACGGAAGFAVDPTHSGSGGCSSAQAGANYGGGGFGSGSYYTNGIGSNGGSGVIRITPIPMN